MKKQILFSVLVFTSTILIAQKSWDLGFTGGTAVYLGDITNVNYQKLLNPVGGIYGRFNFNKRIAVRLQLQLGKIGAEGKFGNNKVGLLSLNGNDPKTSLYVSNPTNYYYFTRLTGGLEGLIEFNYKNYQTGSIKKENSTPYIVTGLGVFYSPGANKGSVIMMPTAKTNANPFATPPTPDYYLPYLVNGEFPYQMNILTVTIPVGVGYKFNVSRSLGGMVELIYSKSFSDAIDNLDDPKRFMAPSGSPLTYNDPSKQLMHNDSFLRLLFSLNFSIAKIKSCYKGNRYNE